MHASAGPSMCRCARPDADNGSRVESVFRPTQTGRFGAYRQHLQWVWLVWLRPVSEVVVAILCVLLSLSIVISEVRVPAGRTP